MHKILPKASVSLLSTPRILLRRHSLRYQETWFGVTAVPRGTEWSETAVKEHNKLRGQNLSTFTCITSVLICPKYLPSTEGVCVAQSK